MAYYLIKSEGSTIKLYVFDGPNFDFGIAQSVSGGINIGGTEIGGEIKNVYENKDLSRFDLQLGTGAGLKYNNFALKAGYDWGMLNRIKGDGMVWRNNDLKVSLAVAF